jgi:hypothetical protein
VVCNLQSFGLDDCDRWAYDIESLADGFPGKRSGPSWLGAENVRCNFATGNSARC